MFFVFLPVHFLFLYRVVQPRLNIGKFTYRYLGFWASNDSSLPKIGEFLIATYYKHPPIRLHEKTVQFWGEFGRNSPKTKSGKFENNFVFSETFRLFLPKIEEFFHAVLQGDVCLIGSNLKLSNFGKRTIVTSPKTKIGKFPMFSLGCTTRYCRGK